MDCVNQNERESSSTPSIAKRNPASGGQGYLALVIAIQCLADVYDVIPFLLVDEVTVVYVPLVMVNQAIFITCVEILEVLREC